MTVDNFTNKLQLNNFRIHKPLPNDQYLTTTKLHYQQNIK